MQVTMSLSVQLTELFNMIRGITVFDVLDIALVSVVLYLLIKFIIDRRAGKLAIGVIILFVLYLLSLSVDMYLIRFLLQNLFQVGIIALVILFQPEIRSMLEKVGNTPMKGLKSIGETKESDTGAVIEEIVSAVSDLAESKTGALIVFERTTMLGDVVSTGTVIDAYPASFLIKNIFFNKAPMHDGALIIRNYRLLAGGCMLPLSVNPDIIKDLGTRHRAGIGISESSDAVVIIVSEETGVISTAVEGKLERGYDRQTLTSFLKKSLTGKEDTSKKSIMGIVRGIAGKGGSEN